MLACASKPDYSNLSKHSAHEHHSILSHQFMTVLYFAKSIEEVNDTEEIII